MRVRELVVDPTAEEEGEILPGRVVKGKGNMRGVTEPIHTLEVGEVVMGSWEASKEDRVGPPPMATPEAGAMVDSGRVAGEAVKSVTLTAVAVGGG